MTGHHNTIWSLSWFHRGKCLWLFYFWTFEWFKYHLDCVL